MSIPIILIPNLLTYKADDYIAIISLNKPKLLSDFENPLEIFGLKIESGTLKSFENSELVSSLLKEGHSLFTPIFNLRICILGNFKGVDDEFDKKRHQNKVLFSPGRRLMKSMDEKLRKTD